MLGKSLKCFAMKTKFAIQLGYEFSILWKFNFYLPARQNPSPNTHEMMMSTFHSQGEETYLARWKLGLVLIQRILLRLKNNQKFSLGQQPFCVEWEIQIFYQNQLRSACAFYSFGLSPVFAYKTFFWCGACASLFNFAQNEKLIMLELG